jgi:hypothetical protein
VKKLQQMAIGQEEEEENWLNPTIEKKMKSTHP